MSEQEEIKTEEQPAAEAASESEQKPDTGEGESPAETTEPEPSSPPEAEPATEDTEQAETQQAETEQEPEQKETEPAQEEAAKEGEKEPAQEEAEPAAKEEEKEPTQEEAKPAAEEGEKEPAAEEGEKEPAAEEGEKEPAQEEAKPAAEEGEKEPAATGEKDEAKPTAEEGEKEPAATGEKEEAKPAATEAEQEPAAKEGEQVAEAEEEEEPEEEEPDDGVPIALVTGASGYIATHLLKQLLEQGRYHVRGTVRNKKKEDKVKPLLNLVPDAKYPLRLVEADLSKPETWKKAVNRCMYVFHVASPFPAGKANEAEIVRTAVEGTTNVLQACADAGTVKRVVVTSSIAAVSCGIGGNPEHPPDYVYTEKDWSLESACAPYEKSKLKAEQAAWEFVKNLDESKRFELAVVNPGYVQGPLLSASSGEGSMEICQLLLNNKMPAVPDVSSPIVDVRDVAAAHIAAMEKSEAAGNRYILTNRTLPFKEMAQIIDAEFRPQGYKISTKNMPKAVMWVGKLFSPRIKQLYANLGKHVKMSNERMVNELGIQPRPIEESIIDTCYSLIDHGLSKKTPRYLGHPSTRPPPEEPETSEGASAAKAKGQEQPEAGSGKTEDKPSESQAEEGSETKEAKESESEETSEKKEEADEAAGATGEQDKPAQEEKDSKEE